MVHVSIIIPAHINSFFVVDIHCWCINVVDEIDICNVKFQNNQQIRSLTFETNLRQPIFCWFLNNLFYNV